MDSPFIVLTQEWIDVYLQNKLSQGVAQVAIAKYKTSLIKLYDWLPDDKRLTLVKLKEWKQSMESQNYSKVTIQGRVRVVNDFLRTQGHPDLCIPKALRFNLTGQTFGYLTVIEPAKKGKRADMIWHCLCKCGKEVYVPSTLLMTGNTTSCGCYCVEILKRANCYVDGTSLRMSLENKPISTRAASGYTGVVEKRGKWQAMITYKGVHYHLGTYTKIEDAVKARARAKELVMEDAARLYEEYSSDYQEESTHSQQKEMRE